MSSIAVGQFFGVDAPDNSEEKKWLNENIVPLRVKEQQSNLNDQGFNNLNYFLEDKTIVALGEVSHGSSEIHLMKGAFVKYLVMRKEFTVFAIEASMPEAFRLNEFILSGKGNAKELIKGLHFWMWDTEEMLDLVEWMRAHNLQNDQKVTFWGFDMQYYAGALSEIQRLFGDANNKIVKELLDELEKKVTELELLRKTDKDSISKLMDRTGLFVQYPLRGSTYFPDNETKFTTICDNFLKNTEQHDWAIQCYRIISQYCAKRTTYTRDSFMASNLNWIKNHTRSPKIIVWAHNGHIQKTNSGMGSHLYRKYKSNYLAIGFAFHDGDYTAEGKDGITTYAAQPSYTGTYEFILKKAYDPAFFLDLKKCDGFVKGCEWIHSNLYFRHTGNGKMRQEFRPWSISESFDAIIFIKHSTPTTLLHKW